MDDAETVRGGPVHKHGAAARKHANKALPALDLCGGGIRGRAVQEGRHEPEGPPPGYEGPDVIALVYACAAAPEAAARETRSVSAFFFDRGRRWLT